MKEKNKEIIVDYTEGNIMRQMLTFAVPLFLCNFIQIVYNMADTVIVGQALATIN